MLALRRTRQDVFPHLRRGDVQYMRRCRTDVRVMQPALRTLCNACACKIYGSPRTLSDHGRVDEPSCTRIRRWKVLYEC